MDEHELLIRHARRWAQDKARDLDEELLSDVLALRDGQDELSYDTWPAGSAERLLLTTWPAYADAVPDLPTLQATLDTFWSFLRATGRMSARSATPAELRKEAKRALPKMQAAYDDPANHSSGRVVLEFGRSMGITLDDAGSDAEIQQRLAEIQNAWNSLPQEERLRRMPDPSPKGAAGQAFSAMFDETDDDDEGDLEGVPDLLPSDPRASARDALSSAFVRKCLELAGWVGRGKEATARGVLRPAVAREAYRELDLWSWERSHNQFITGHRPEDDDPEVDALRAEAAAKGWRSAGDCLALDRLWMSLEVAGLVEHRGTKVRATAQPETDDDWVIAALGLLAGLCRRLGSHVHEPMPGVLLIAQVGGGTTTLTEVRSWWHSRNPPPPDGLPEDLWQHRLEWFFFHFADCNLWRIEGDRLTLTALGNDFTAAYLRLSEQGIFDD